MNITVITYQEGGAIACLESNSQMSAVGESKDEAIVKLIEKHPEIFGITIITKPKE